VIGTDAVLLVDLRGSSGVAQDVALLECGYYDKESEGRGEEAFVPITPSS